MPFQENLGGLHEEQPAGEVFFHEDIPHVFGEVEQIIKGTGQIRTGNLPHKYVVIQPIWESVLQVYGAAAYEAQNFWWSKSCRFLWAISTHVSSRAGCSSVILPRK